jgi:hypothetical protein
MEDNADSIAAVAPNAADQEVRPATARTKTAKP